MLIIFWSTVAVLPPDPLAHTPDPRRHRLPVSPSPSSAFWPPPLYYSLQHFYELWSAFPLLGAHHILMCRITRRSISLSISLSLSRFGFFLFFKLFSRDLQFVILAGNLIGLPHPVWHLKSPLLGGWMSLPCASPSPSHLRSPSSFKPLYSTIAPGTARTLREMEEHINWLLINALKSAAWTCSKPFLISQLT